MLPEDPSLSSDVSGFDLDRANQQAWDAFAVRLAEVLSVMDPGATLTISGLAPAEGTPPDYVLFTAGAEGSLTAAVASDPYGDAVGALGWTGPAGQAGARGAYTRAGTQELSGDLAAAVVTVLREVYGVPHPAFLAPDQLAEILTPVAPQEAPAEGDDEFGPDDIVATMPTSREHLDHLVTATLTRLLGHDPVRDAEGDLGLRVGSSMLFVRTSKDGREVLVFSPMVHEIEGRSRAMEVLSDLNADIRFARFWLLRDRVYLSASIFARPFVPAHLEQAIELLSVTADSLDDDLALKLRGRTSFTDDDPA